MPLFHHEAQEMWLPSILGWSLSSPTRRQITSDSLRRIFEFRFGELPSMRPAIPSRMVCSVARRSRPSMPAESDALLLPVPASSQQSVKRPRLISAEEERNLGFLTPIKS